MAIITILIITYVMYKAGLMRRLLMACVIPGNETQIIYDNVETFDIIENPFDDSRESLEKRASYIVAEKGHNPATVKYMGDTLLMHLIRDYNNAIEQLVGYGKVGREDMERIAANMLYARGCNYDANKKVRYLRDAELEHIIQGGF